MYVCMYLFIHHSNIILNNRNIDALWFILFCLLSLKMIESTSSAQGKHLTIWLVITVSNISVIKVFILYVKRKQTVWLLIFFKTSYF